MGSLGSSKTLLRKHFASQRDGIGDVLREKHDRSIKQKTVELIQTLKKSKTSIWAAYRPIRSEVDPSPIVESLSTELKWAFPVVKNNQMKFFIPNDSESFCTSSLGIQEPDPESSVEAQTQDIEGCLVPGLAFDRKGGRLGYGKGYYDRFLDHFNGFSIGLSYDVQLASEELPHESTDVPVHFVVTETQLLRTMSV